MHSTSSIYWIWLSEAVLIGGALVFARASIVLVTMSRRVSGWVESEGLLEWLEVKENKASLSPRRYELKTNYSYHYNDKNYSGSKVSILDFTPYVFARYDRPASVRLTIAFEERKPARMWINPKAPEQAVLLDLSQDGYLFRCLGFFLLFAVPAVLGLYLAQPSVAALVFELLLGTTIYLVWTRLG